MAVDFAWLATDVMLIVETGVVKTFAVEVADLRVNEVVLPANVLVFGVAIFVLDVVSVVDVSFVDFIGFVVVIGLDVISADGVDVIPTDGADAAVVVGIRDNVDSGRVEMGDDVEEEDEGETFDDGDDDERSAVDVAESATSVVS